MSKFREDVLTVVATYCQNHTGIDPWDIVAFYASVSIPSWKGKNREAAVQENASRLIAQIKSMPEEYFEGEYSKVMQDRWDQGCKGRLYGERNGSIMSPHYYCTRICQSI